MTPKQLRDAANHPWEECLVCGEPVDPTRAVKATRDDVVRYAHMDCAVRLALSQTPN